MNYKILNKFNYFSYIGFALIVAGVIVYAISGEPIWPLFIIGSTLGGIYLGAYLAVRATYKTQEEDTTIDVTQPPPDDQDCIRIGDEKMPPK